MELYVVRGYKCPKIEKCEYTHVVGMESYYHDKEWVCFVEDGFAYYPAAAKALKQRCRKILVENKRLLAELEKENAMLQKVIDK